MRRGLLIGALLVLTTACPIRLPERSGVTAVPRNSNLYLYLRASADERERLSYRLVSVEARTAEGGRERLELRRRDVEGGERGPGRLLAVGAVPVGQYEGLTFRVESASVSRPDGDADLRILEPESTAELAFRVSRGDATVLYVDLDAGTSMQGGFGLNPVFRVRRPEKIAPGRVGWVVGRRSEAAVVFDKREGHVVAVFHPEAGPGGVAIDAAAGRGYVVLPEVDSVAAVDLLSFTTTESVRLVGGDRPETLALSADRAHLVTVNRGSDTVNLLDPATLIERERLTVGDEPGFVLIDRNSRRAFVTNAESNSVSVVDLLAEQVVATVVVESEPFRVALDRAERRLYVAHRASPQLDVVDLSSFSIERRVYVGPGVSALAVDRGTDLIYVGKGPDRAVEIYDPGSLLPVDSIRTAGHPAVLAIDEDEDVLFIGVAEPHAVEAVRRVGGDLLYRLDLEDEPEWLAIAGER